MATISRRKFLKILSGTTLSLVSSQALAACSRQVSPPTNTPTRTPTSTVTLPPPTPTPTFTASPTTPSTPTLPELTATPTLTSTPTISPEELKLPFYQQNWTRSADPYPLPDWFTNTRVQGYCGLTLPWMDKPEFQHAAEGFKGLGAQVFTRYVKSGEEDPWWPSAVPVGTDGLPILSKDRKIGKIDIPAGKNLVQEMVSEAQQAGLKLIVYYRHMSDKTLETLHPEWVCHNVKGGIDDPTRGAYLDITSAYREMVLQRLVELAKMGVDGFYFDSTHLPSDGCFKTALQQDFQLATGKDLPQSANETDPAFLLYLEWEADQVEKTFIYWRDTIKPRFPEVVFIISTTFLPVLDNRRMTTNLARLADSAKNEYNPATDGSINLDVPNPRYALSRLHDDIRMALGWTLLRDAAEGRPPYIWAPGFPNEKHKLAFTAAVLTYGAVANINVMKEYLLNAADAAGQTERAGAQQAFTLGNLVSPYLAQAQPLRWAAIHFSELSRNQRNGITNRENREVLWPLISAYRELVQAGVPVGIVNDRQLDQGLLDGYQLIFLPTPAELLPGQKDAIQSFKAAGGHVIENQASWAWSNPQPNGNATASLRAAIQPFLAEAPVQVSGSAQRQAVAYRNLQTGQLIVAVTQEFSWIQLQEIGKTFTDPLNEPPPPLDGVVITVRGASLPQKVSEIISGQVLTPVKTSTGYQVTLPAFSPFALMIAEP